MAIYSLNISSASSAVAALSYITSMRVRDDARGETYSGFGRRERVAHVATLLPEGAPSGYADPERLFNAAQAAERGRLLRNAEQVAGEQSERLRGAVPWLEDADIPADWDQANRFRMRTTKAIHDHDMQPRTRLVAELERRLEQAERAESERPSPEQVKALALRMAEQRAQAENPTQDTKRPAPSGDEPLDLSEPEDWGEASPFESRQAPRTKADLLNEIRQRTDRLTGQQEAEQRQIDPWQAQPPQRRGHGR